MLIDGYFYLFFWSINCLQASFPLSRSYAVVTEGSGRKRLISAGDVQSAVCLHISRLLSAALAGCFCGQLASLPGCRVLGGVADLNKTLLKP